MIFYLLPGINSQNKGKIIIFLSKKYFLILLNELDCKYYLEPTYLKYYYHVRAKHILYTSTRGVKVRNMKMDFNTGGTWRRVGQ